MKNPAILLLIGVIFPPLLPANSAAAPQLTATWTKKASADAPAGPGRRGWIRFGYDSVNKKTVLMAGSGSSYFNDVWHYDSAADKWSNLEPLIKCPQGFTPPTQRDEQAIEYDPFNHLYWMFGGTGYGCVGTVRTAQAGTDTLAIIDSTLTAATADFYKDWTVQVSGKTAYVDGYDPVAKKLALSTPITGLTGGSSYYLYPQRGGGTWNYSPVTRTWSGLSARVWGYGGPSPTSRLSPAFAYSTADRAILMFGGYSMGAPNDLWALDVETKTWLQLRPNNDQAGPPGRLQLQNSMVYDSANDAFVLFGGKCGVSNRCTYNSALNDTWIYRMATNTWTRMEPPVSPPPRYQHHMAYDSAHNIVVMHGGVNGNVVLGDTWVYDVPSNTWTQLQPALAPPGRFLGAFAYDPGQQLFVLYGGNGPVNYTRSDVWTLKLESAVATPNTPPSAVATVTPASGTVTTTFQFDGSASTDPDGVVVSHLWNFGDGTSSTLANPTKTYTQGGNYLVTLTVTDDKGATATATLNVSVQALTSPPQISLPSGRVSGTIDDPAVTQVLVNGAPVPVVNGQFEATTALGVGTTMLTIQATGTGGTASRKVTISVE